MQKGAFCAFQNTPKCVSSRGSAPDPLRSSRRLGMDTSPTTHPNSAPSAPLLSRLRRLDYRGAGIGPIYLLCRTVPEATAMSVLRPKKPISTGDISLYGIYSKHCRHWLNLNKVFYLTKCCIHHTVLVKRWQKWLWNEVTWVSRADWQQSLTVTSQSTDHRSVWGQSLQPISWLLTVVFTGQIT